jgi:hypothetical protein
MRWFTVVNLLSFVGLSFVGLSCGSSSSNSSSNSIPRADACLQASQAACAKVFACPTTDPIVAGIRVMLGGSDDACEATIQANYCSAFECATAADYHGDKAAQCKQEFTDVTCSALSAAGLGAITGGVASFLAAFPQCGQICGGADGGP